MRDRGRIYSLLGTVIKPDAFILILTAAAVLLLLGCSSTKTKVESGAIRGSTFSFVSFRPSLNTTESSQPIHAAIQEAITKNLAARGVTRVPTGGDLSIGYLVVTGDNTSTKSINEYFGYSQDSADLYDKAHKAYTENKNPNHFEAGTLLIDIIDPKTFKVLKRNYATRSLLRNPPPDVRAGRIQEVVDEILRDVQITH
jgi:hypothetical protein